MMPKTRGEAEALRLATKAVMVELWWCALQLGCDWKDERWRERSSVGRAYDAALTALSAHEKEET